MSQEKINREFISVIAEEISSGSENTIDLETFEDKLYELENDPVRINRGSLKETGRLFFLTEYQIRNLTEYVRINGRIISSAEILNIRGFDRVTVSGMLPFITLRDGLRGSQWFSRLSNHTFLNSFTLKKDASDSETLGSQWKIVSKYRFVSGRFTTGFTAEKDAGEQFISGKSGLPDFFSAYSCYQGSRFLQKLIAGDYSARFGIGSLINTGFRSGISLSDPGSLSAVCEIKPHTSTDENNFFRGVAAILGSGKIETTFFLSANNLDATTITGSDTTSLFVRSLYTAGLHSTATYMRKKDVVNETTWGINIAGYFRNFNTGFLVTENIFSLPFAPDRTKPENLYDFSGDRNLLAGFYYGLNAGRFILSGEVASDRKLEPAIIQAVTFVPGDRISFSFLYRYFSPGFNSFHGKGVFSGSKPKNEEAISCSMRFEAARNLFIGAGSELKRYPWARYLTSFPSSSVRNEIKLRYAPGKINIEALYNFRYSESNLNVATGMPMVKEVRTNLFSIRIRVTATDYLTTVTRADIKTCSPHEGPGMMLYQDLLWKPENVPLRFWFRYCIFTTGGWNTRIYSYENDLLNSFSIPVLSGRGSRTYLMVEYKPAEKVNLRVKYGITSKITGMDEEKFKDEIKFQVKISL